MESLRKYGLTQNELKIIAAVSMVIDHIGVMFFPQVAAFRILGRLAFPIFSYCIYEGYRYTHNKLKYFLQILALGLLCMVGYYVFADEVYGNVLITFSLSIVVLFAVDFFKYNLTKNKWFRLLGCAAVLAAVLGAYGVTEWFYVDYGLYGVLLPAFAALPDDGEKGKNNLSLIGFSIGLAVLAIELREHQWASLFALPLLVAYSGNRGKHNMKSFFYWFYPVHLAVIGIASLAVEM